jgi:hypothetical protein
MPNPDISLAVVVHRRAQPHPRRAALIAAMSIFPMPVIASNARFASSPPAASASVSTRGVICQEMPHLSLHQPHWLSWPPLPTGDLEREGFVVLERGTADEADTGDARDRELDRQHVTLLARWVVAGCTVNGTYRAIGKGLGIEARSCLGVFVVP